MKKFYSFIAVLFFYCASSYAQAPVITVNPTAYNENIGAGSSKTVSVTIQNSGERDLNWEFNGAMVYFVKPDYANYTLAAYQDRISDNLWLTRADVKGIFNIKMENSYETNDYTSPMGTLWASGSLMDGITKDYVAWESAVNGNPPNMVGKTLTMHSIADDQYYDFKWETWTSNGMGGGMSYKRYHVYPWLNPAATSGVVLPYKTYNLDINLDVSTLSVGTYNIKMYLYSNDPAKNTIEIPFTITITDVPNLFTPSTSIDFGKKAHGGSYPYPVKIENTGTQALTVSSIVTSDPAFTVNETTFTVQPNESHTLNVIFSPTEIKTYSGELTIISNSAGNTTAKIALTGNGAGAPNIVLNPVSFDESILVGQTAIKTLTIQNTGNYNLTWSASIRPEVISKVTFSKLDNVDQTLPENQDYITNNISLTRTTVYYDGLYNIKQEAGFISAGDSPLGTLWAFGNSGEVSPSEYKKWQSTIGSLSDIQQMVNKPLSVYLYDVNNYIDLTFNSWNSNTWGGAFSYTRDNVVNYCYLSATSGTVPGMSSANVDVTFDATHLVNGIYEAIVEINHNSPQDKIDIPIKLTVTGGTPTISASAFDFGSVYTSGSKTIDLEVFNKGTADLNISSFTSDNTDFVVTTQAIVIKANEKGTIKVKFTPSSDGAKSGNLTINSDDAINPALVVNLVGLGVLPPVAEIETTSIDISVEAGLTGSKTITINNTGLSNLGWDVALSPVKTNSVVTFTKADYADFTLPANQDKIADDVIIARKDNKDIFNIAQENEYGFNYFISPKGTLWANGSTIDKKSTDYVAWQTTAYSWGDITNMVGKPLSVYLQNQNKYFDVTFQSWTNGNAGGGFSYTRDATPFDWNYLNLNFVSGVISGGGSYDVVLTADALKLLPGEYNSEVQITTTDSTNKLVTIPVKVTVTAGKPTIAASTLDFGVSSTEIQKTLNLEVFNNGFDTLKIADFSSNYAAFVVNTQPISIQPQKSAKIPVIYTAGVGAETGILTINSNDPVNPAFTVSLTGSGAEAPQLIVDSTPIAKTLVAGTTEVVTLSLSNDGEISIEGSVGVADSAPLQFEKLSNSDWTLAENQDRITDNVWLTRGNINGLFNIKVETGNDGSSPKGTSWALGKTASHTLADYSSWIIAVAYNPTGSVGNTYSMYDEAAMRFFDITIDSWDDGSAPNTPVGGFSYTRTEVPFWVTNVTALSPILGAGSQNIDFTLNATNLVAGVYNTKVYIKTNDPANPEVIIPVTLTVTGTPTLSVPTSFAFDDQPFGGTQTKNLIISNTGTDVLNITGISNTTSAFVLSATSLSINPGTSYSLPIKFSPTGALQYDDVLTLISNDPVNDTVYVALSGKGTPLPVILVSGIPISEKFLNSETKTAKIVIKNRGAADLNWKIEGQSVTFTKQDNANYTLPENQDRISDNVWITRKSTQAIFNIKTESGYSSTSPQGTLWTYGNTADVSQSDYKTWFLAVNGDPQGMIGKDMSLYLVNDLKYFDIKFSSYTGGGSGGGFSYTRKEILPSWMSIDLPSGNIHAAEDTTVTVTLNASGLTGSYSTNFDIISDDPITPRVSVSVSISVGGILIVNPVADIRQNQGSYSFYLDVSNVFQSKTAITIEPFSNNPSVATVSISGNILKVNKVGPGDSQISLRAEDNNGNIAYDDFKFTVNAGPIVANPIADVMTNQGFGTYSIDLSNVFVDINGDAIQLSAYSNSPTVATAAVNGNMLTITEISNGTATITVSAKDGFAVNATVDNFNFRINAKPTVANPLPDIALNKNFGIKTIDLLNVFADADADKLTYTVSSNNDAVITTGINSRTLTITEVGLGSANITVTANDGKGGTVSDEFTCTVSIGIGVEELANSSISLFPNPTTGKLTIKLSDSLKDNVFIHVFSVIGVEVFKQDATGANGLVHLDLSSLSRGVYFIQVVEGSKVVSTNKIIYE